MLDKLPQEILDLILADVDAACLLGIPQVCRSLHVAISPHLHKTYESITLKLTTNWSSCRKFPVSLHDRRAVKFARHLQLVDGAANLLSDGVMLRHLNDYHSAGYDGDGNTAGDRLGHILLPLFKRLGENSLLTFTWDIGTCVPLQILGPLGYLPTYQRNIEALDLNHIICESVSSGDSKVDLNHRLSISQFDRIRKLRWVGLNSINTCISLMEFFRVNAGRLEDLDLSYGPLYYNRGNVPETWMKCMALSPRHGDIFAFNVLGAEENEERIIFPCLESLSLMKIDFSFATNEMAYAFRANKLRYLKLHSCRDAPKFLATVAQMGSNSDLITLHLIFRPSQDRDYVLTTSFLESSLPKIEDVFIYLWADGPDFTSHYWKSIFIPGRTLKRFVYHRGLVERVGGDGKYFKNLGDAPIRWDQSMANLLACANLECIGLCDRPLSLMEQFRTSPPLSCKILHIRGVSSCSSGVSLYIPHNHKQHNHMQLNAIFDRVAGLNGDLRAIMTAVRELPSCCCSNNLTEFLIFADWAFGPRGLPRLKILAYGRFEPENVTDPQCYGLLLCRNDNPSLELASLELAFRRVDNGDTDLLAEVDRHQDFFQGEQHRLIDSR